MNQGLLNTQFVTQIGIVVHDIERTSKDYAEFFGIAQPEWNWTDYYERAKTQFEQTPSEARAKLAFFHMGSLDIELIEPDSEPSTWREFLNIHGEGVHHIAFVVKDIHGKVKTLESHDMPLIQSGDYTGGRYAYVDTFDKLKVMIELLENL